MRHRVVSSPRTVSRLHSAIGSLLDGFAPNTPVADALNHHVHHACRRFVSPGEGVISSRAPTNQAPPMGRAINLRPTVPGLVALATRCELLEALGMIMSQQVLLGCRAFSAVAICLQRDCVVVVDATLSPRGHLQKIEHRRICGGDSISADVTTPIRWCARGGRERYDAAEHDSTTSRQRLARFTTHTSLWSSCR